jgi:uncharacterized protein (TIGR02001 family)
MLKNKLLYTLILTALSAPGLALAADAPATPPAVTANVALVTNYLYRGISQTGGKPAIQGGFDYAHASGFYAGVWGSNISWLNTSASNSSLELDTYLGFKNAFATDYSYDVGFLRYNYPGVYPNPIPTGFAKADTNEIYGLIGWKWVTLKYSYSLGDTFGLAEAKGTSYIDLSASYPIADSGVTLGAHYGKQTYKGTYANPLPAAGGYAAGASATYSDYKLSVTKDFSGYAWGLAYSSTNATKGLGQFYNAVLADGSNIDLGKSAVVLSVAHSF